MKKLPFLRPLTLSVLLFGFSAAADEVSDLTKLQAERERLIDLVIELEGSFSETLTHYQTLQNDFRTLNM